jgi:hypothetical protein
VGERGSNYQAKQERRDDADSKEAKISQSKAATMDLNFFCTVADVVLCMKGTEDQEPLQYHLKESATPSSEPVLTITAVAPDVIARHERQFLASRRGDQLRVRKVEPSSGHPWYAFDQVENPDAVMLYFGSQTGTVLTPGSVSTLGGSSEAVSLFKLISKHFKKKCRRVKSYWVGPEALALLRSGWRLTVNETASRTYDLRED